MTIVEKAVLEDEAEHKQLLYLMELKDEYYRFHQVRYTDTELLKIFPEVDETLLLQKLREWETVKQIMYAAIRKKLKIFKLIANNSTDFLFLRQGLKLSEAKKVIEAKKQINRLRALLWIKRGKVLKGKLTGEQIYQAKQVPLENLYGQKLRRAGKTLVALCPFHKERHASFTIYRATNTFKCFGCGEYGDSIKFVRLLHGYDFKQSVRYLIGE